MNTKTRKIVYIAPISDFLATNIIFHITYKLTEVWGYVLTNSATTLNLFTIYLSKISSLINRSWEADSYWPIWLIWAHAEVHSHNSEFKGHVTSLSLSTSPELSCFLRLQPLHFNSTMQCILWNWLIDWSTALRHISTERLLGPRNAAKLETIKSQR